MTAVTKPPMPNRPSPNHLGPNCPGPNHRPTPPLRASACFCLGLVLLSAAALRSARTKPTVAYAASEAVHLSQPDTVCRSCHQEIYDRYEKTPMARGSGIAADGLDAAELAANDLVHAPSGVRYHISARDGQPYLSYSRPATSPQGALSGEHRLDLFVGSGLRGRTYLYNQGGLWFEAPINWYGKRQVWDMAPAFDNSASMPAPLPVDPNCLHCHAGDVQPSSGTVRNRFSDQPFRSGGVGCSACHGNVAIHLAKQLLLSQDHSKPQGAAIGLQAGTRDLRSGDDIVNPSRLEPHRRDSVCLQCHLEGDAAVYLPGKSLQAFKPGDDLSASVMYFVDSAKAELRVRASSQYEALLRSACKRAVGDRMTCTTCHDPHGSPSAADRVAFFRAQCISCHSGPEIETLHHPEQQNCAACHMPARKTADISHEQTTDHDIEPRPKTPSALPSGSTVPSAARLVQVGIDSASDRELGLAYAQLAQRGDRASGIQALALLTKAEHAGSHDVEVLDQLGFLLQVSGSTTAAADHYRQALATAPHDLTAAANLAVIDAGKGMQEQAIKLLTQVVQDDPSRTAAGLNLAFLQCRNGQRTSARQTVDLMLLYHPDSLAARQMLASGTYGGQRCAIN